jgi:NADH-quinone oxidoreductase subunit M
MAWSFYCRNVSTLALPGLSSFVKEFLVQLSRFHRYPVHAIIGVTFGIILFRLYILIPVQKCRAGPTTAGNETLIFQLAELANAPVIANCFRLGPSPVVTTDEAAHEKRERFTITAKTVKHLYLGNQTK